MSSSTVSLGEHSFDPLETQDFRLAVEGASKTGKSNTLAVILEDLAEVTVPTLVVERLGILSTVRKLDDQIVVVGARDEPGIDLPVPLDQLEIVAELVLEEGLKVILDISTYSGIEDDQHTEHKAAATVLKSLNDRAQARLRSGNRRKALVLIDEVHVLAPENNAPHIDLDDYVRRCRAQIVKLSTEGGNKGLSLITAYQRRAYTSKGVVSQSDNYVIHRLHATDRSDVAREIGVDEEEIEQLGTGEVLVYGDFTRQRVVGPTTVRKRRSPDPREETFELPDPPAELSATIADLREQIDQRETEAARRRDRVDELETERDRLQEKIDDLEEQVRTANVLEKLAEGRIPGGAEAVEGELAEELESLQERNEQLRFENEDLRADLGVYEQTIDGLQEEIEEKDERIEQLETELAEYRELDVVRDEVVSSARSILRQLGASDPEIEDLEEELATLREENRDLQEQLEESVTAGDVAPRARQVAAVDDLASLIQHDAIQAAVDVAKENTEIQPEHFDRALSILASAEGGPLEKIDLLPLMDVGDSAVGKVLRGLFEAGVLQREKDGRTYRYELDRGFLERRVEVANQQARFSS